jgi:hypothetical protein
MKTVAANDNDNGETDKGEEEPDLTPEDLEQDDPETLEAEDEEEDEEEEDEEEEEGVKREEAGKDYDPVAEGLEYFMVRDNVTWSGTILFVRFTMSSAVLLFAHGFIVVPAASGHFVTCDCGREIRNIPSAIKSHVASDRHKRFAKVSIPIPNMASITVSVRLTVDQAAVFDTLTQAIEEYFAQIKPTEEECRQVRLLRRKFVSFPVRDVNVLFTARTFPQTI